MRNRYISCFRSVGAQIKDRACRWGQAEDGAVTVDWVVLTATMTVIGGVIVSLTVDGTTDVGNQIGTVLAEKTVSE
ncbi:hypothetical protein [Neptunicoccus cionae]|uniref:hypothetical protein n=1 Tax=Neptunicoccus cionae TaxID=2035344 RepID=UPI0025703965|nr:hypothetical protein [Amylibacter cionae]